MHSYVVIGGAGRAGTTFIVQVLTLAGVRTGFDEDDVLTPAGARKRDTTKLWVTAIYNW